MINFAKFIFIKVSILIPAPWIISISLMFFLFFITFILFILFLNFSSCNMFCLFNFISWKLCPQFTKFFMIFFNIIFTIDYNYIFLISFSRLKCPIERSSKQKHLINNHKFIMHMILYFIISSAFNTFICHSLSICSFSFHCFIISNNSYNNTSFFCLKKSTS